MSLDIDQRPTAGEMAELLRNLPPESEEPLLDVQPNMCIWSPEFAETFDQLFEYFQYGVFPPYVSHEAVRLLTGFKDRTLFAPEVAQGFQLLFPRPGPKVRTLSDLVIDQLQHFPGGRDVNQPNVVANVAIAGTVDKAPPPLPGAEIKPAVRKPRGFVGRVRGLLGRLLPLSSRPKTGCDCAQAAWVRWD